MNDYSLKDLLRPIVFALFLAIFLLVGARLIPWSGVNWGQIEFGTAPTITVTGEAKLKQKSQIATFSAGVTVYNDDKQIAINEVNSKMTQTIEEVKKLGIDQKDIQTQQVSTYEQQDRLLLTYPEQIVPGKWLATNSISIILRNVDNASKLTDTLNRSGATEVTGPNFSLDPDQDNDSELMELAVKDAKQKAEKTAQAVGRKLGKVITVNEGFSGPIYPMAFDLAKGSGREQSAPIEPGTQTATKTVNVVFELR